MDPNAPDRRPPSVHYPRVIHPTAATLLILAARQGHVGIASDLLAAGANRLTQDSKGMDFGLYAVKSHHLPTLRLALEAMPKGYVPLTGTKGITALMEATAWGNMEAMELVLRWPHDVYAKDNLGQTALHWACAHANVPAARYLIELGCEVDARCVRGMTPLMRASRVHCLDLMADLVAAGAEVDALDAQGLSIAMWLCQRKKRGESLGKILALGADPNLRLAGLPQGKTALAFAIESWSPSHAADLAKAGADAESCAPGSTPFALLARSVSGEEHVGPFLDILKGLGADINRMDDDGRAPLSCSRSDFKLWIRAGANPEFSMPDGSNFLEYFCIFKGGLRIVEAEHVELFLKYGARITPRLSSLIADESERLVSSGQRFRGFAWVEVIRRCERMRKEASELDAILDQSPKKIPGPRL